MERTGKPMVGDVVEEFGKAFALALTKETAEETIRRVLRSPKAVYGVGPLKEAVWGLGDEGLKEIFLLEALESGFFFEEVALFPKALAWVEARGSQYQRFMLEGAVAAMAPKGEKGEAGGEGSPHLRAGAGDDQGSQGRGDSQGSKRTGPLQPHLARP